MNSFYYQAPLVKSSTKSCEVMNIDGVSVGSVQRYFNSILHSIIDSIIGSNNLIVRMKAMNPEGSTVIDAYTKITMIKRPDYYIHFKNSEWEGVTFQARQLNNIKFNAEFIIKSDSLEIISKQDTFDWVRFYEEGKEVARWHSRAKEKFKTHIEIENGASVQNPLFYAVLGQLLYFIGY